MTAGLVSFDIKRDNDNVLKLSGFGGGNHRYISLSQLTDL